MSAADLYELDFYEWTRRNAELLRTGRLSEADLEHIAEEIEDMGRNRRDAIASRLGRLMQHLLKWQFQPEKRSRSWLRTCAEQRVRIAALLSYNPSLRAQLEELADLAYSNAIKLAAVDTGLARKTFPNSRPWTVDQLLDDDFLP